MYSVLNKLSEYTYILLPIKKHYFIYLIHFILALFLKHFSVSLKRNSNQESKRTNKKTIKGVTLLTQHIFSYDFSQLLYQKSV